MGIPFSILPVKGMLSPHTIVDKVYEEIVANSEHKEMDFETIHLAVIRILNGINSCLPGRHYDTPSQQEVKVFYNEWKGELDKEMKKKKLLAFIDTLMKRDVKSNKNVVITGIVAPPVAMITKRIGEQMPPLKRTLKFVPDAAFVPAFTIGALFAVKALQTNVFEQIRKLA